MTATMTTTAPTKRNEFASLIESLINESSKTQVQIANDMGYDNQNIITMFKKGTTRIPLEKVTLLARSVNEDPGVLMRLWFEAYMPQALYDIENHIGFILTTSEKSWVNALRKELTPIPPFDNRFMAGIKAIIHSFK